jgi:ribosomal protein RSM22 (predicted rRNA methylase)
VRKTYQPLPLSVAALARITQVTQALHGAPLGSKTHARVMGEAVAALSHVYTRERTQMAGLDKRALLARAGFFFPRDLPKVFGPLDELLRLGRAPNQHTLRVLDVGAGLGATSFGLARWLRARALPVQMLNVTALERETGALRGFGAFVRAFTDLPDELVPIELTAHTTDLRAMRISDKFDLVLFGFVLNELYLELPEAERLARRAELLLQASERLAPGGSIIVLEPALKATTRELMQLRDLVAARASAPFVLAPCLHARRCPMLPSPRDWCHQELSYVLPPHLVDVAKVAQLRYEGLRYASLVLSNTPRPADGDEALYRIVSDRLVSKGKLELIGCGSRHYQRFTRLDRAESPDNAAFGSAERGALLTIESAAPRIEASTRVGSR